MKRTCIAISLGLTVAGCDPTTRAIITATPVVAAINNPALDPGDKTCVVLDWGIPIAEARATTWQPWQRQALAIAKQTAAAGCLIGDATWRQRAVTAGVELSRALWDAARR
jgi:hypothetical protein